MASGNKPHQFFFQHIFLLYLFYHLPKKIRVMKKISTLFFCFFVAFSTQAQQLDIANKLTIASVVFAEPAMTLASNLQFDLRRVAPSPYDKEAYRHKLAQGIVMTAVGGGLTFISLPLMIGGAASIGWSGDAIPGVPLLVIGAACAGAGIPLLIIGVSRIKKARAMKNGAYFEPTFNPNFSISSGSASVQGGMRLHF